MVVFYAMVLLEWMIDNSGFEVNPLWVWSSLIQGLAVSNTVSSKNQKKWL